MPRCLELAPPCSAADLEHHYRQSHDPGERTHWHMLWLVAQGHSCPTVATMVGSSEDWGRTIVHRYNAAGSDGVRDHRRAHPGPRPLLPSAVRAELSQVLAADPLDGGLWTSPKVATWMGERRGCPVSKQRAGEAMRSLGFTLHRPRPRATTADPEAQEAFKKGCFTRR